MAKKQDESKVRSVKVRDESITWRTVAIFALFVWIISFVIWVFFAQPTLVELQCELANWKPLENNRTWMGELEMYPDYANCHVMGEGNIFKWMMQVND